MFSYTIEQHIERLDLVLSRLGQFNLKVKLSKCSFFQSEVTYLGHVISAAGVATDPEKIQAVAKWHRPQNLADLKSSFWRSMLATRGWVLCCCKRLRDRGGQWHMPAVDFGHRSEIWKTTVR